MSPIARQLLTTYDWRGTLLMRFLFRKGKHDTAGEEQSAGRELQNVRGQGERARGG